MAPLNLVGEGAGTAWRGRVSGRVVWGVESRRHLCWSPRRGLARPARVGRRRCHRPFSCAAVT
eukprot:363881-Chlamydomonas_euryale.AAC.8